MNIRYDGLRHKKYRKYRADIWTNLTHRGKHNFMTTLMIRYAQQDFRKHLRHQPRYRRRYLLRSMPRQKPNADTLNDLIKFIKPIKSKMRGIIMKNRKILSLYYNHSLRSKTWRHMSKLASERYNSPTTTYAAFLEHRIDVLLVRACFVDSIFVARQIVARNGVFVDGRHLVTDCRYQLAPYQRFAPKVKWQHTLVKVTQYLIAEKPERIVVSYKQKPYIRKVKSDEWVSKPSMLYLKMEKRLKEGTLLCKPSYLWINYDLLFAFLLKHIELSMISYTFSTGNSYLGAFRKSYNYLYT